MAKLPKDRKMCKACDKRPALFRVYQGGRLSSVKSDKQHDICRQCYRSIRESQYQVAVNG